MFKRMMPVIFAAALGLAPACAQDKPAIVVHDFTLAPDVKFPYDMNQLQTRAIAMLKDKDGTLFDALPTAPTVQVRVYILDAEVLEGHKGNTAERDRKSVGEGNR